MLPVSFQIRVTNLTRAAVVTRSFLSSLIPLSHHEIFVVDYPGFFGLLLPGGVGQWAGPSAEKSSAKRRTLLISRYHGSYYSCFGQWLSTFPVPDPNSMVSRDPSVVFPSLGGETPQNPPQRTDRCEEEE